jgi:hypothetical protein
MIKSNENFIIRLSFFRFSGSRSCFGCSRYTRARNHPVHSVVLSPIPTVSLNTYGGSIVLFDPFAITFPVVHAGAIVASFSFVAWNRRNSQECIVPWSWAYFLGIFLIPSLPALKFRSLAKGFRRLSISVGGGGASDDGPAAGSENEERDGNPFIYRHP